MGIAKDIRRKLVKAPGPGAYSESSPLARTRAPCGVSYKTSKVDRFVPMMHAVHYDVATTPVARPRGTGNLGPTTYDVPAGFVNSGTGPDIESQYHTSEKWQFAKMKGDFIAKSQKTILLPDGSQSPRKRNIKRLGEAGVRDCKWFASSSHYQHPGQPSHSPRHMPSSKRSFSSPQSPKGARPPSAPKVPNPAHYPGPGHYKDPAACMAWAKRTMPDAIAEGVLSSPATCEPPHGRMSVIPPDSGLWLVERDSMGMPDEAYKHHPRSRPRPKE